MNGSKRSGKDGKSIPLCAEFGRRLSPFKRVSVSSIGGSNPSSGTIGSVTQLVE